MMSFEHLDYEGYLVVCPGKLSNLMRVLQYRQDRSLFEVYVDMTDKRVLK